MPNNLLNYLVGYWTLDESAGSTRNDSSGNANNLVDHNTVGSGTGIINGDATFNGSNQYLSIADNSILSIGSGQSFDIWGWTKLAALTTGTIIQKAGNGFGTNSEFVAQYSAGTGGLFFGIANGTNQHSTTNTNMSSTGVWYFWVVWFDAVGFTINVQINNGTVQSQSTSSHSSQDTTFALTLGATSTPNIYLNGETDEVGMRIDRIGNSNLSSTQRATLYNSGAGFPFSSYDSGFIPSGFLSFR